MNTKFIFRNGTIVDLNQIKDLTLLAYGQFRNVISKENAEVWGENFRDENTYIDLFKIAACFVCEYDNKIVGVAFLVPHGNPYKWFEPGWAYIRLVGVHPNFEGKGIGKKLTQLCIDVAKNTGEKIIALHTSEFQNAARHIYECAGFKKQKEFELFNKKYWVYTLQLN